MSLHYTYDPTNLPSSTLNQTRFHTQDVGDSTGISAANARHSDEEINGIITIVSGNVYLAAALLLEADLVTLTSDGDIIKLGPFGDNESVVAINMKELVIYLRNRAGGIVSVNSPTLVFSMDSGVGASTLGTMHVW